jgi:hypothetical protein
MTPPDEAVGKAIMTSCNEMKKHSKMENKQYLISAFTFCLLLPFYLAGQHKVLCAPPEPIYQKLHVSKKKKRRVS